MAQAIKLLRRNRLVNLAVQAKDRLKSRSLLSRCLRKISRAFPGVAFSHAQLINHGHDHAVVILDNQKLFRFPRHQVAAAALPYEIRLLAELRARTTTLVPDYVFVAPGTEFAGYTRLEGEELTHELFQSLDRPAQEQVLIQIADFLGTLHALPSELITRPDGVAPTLEADRYYTEGRSPENWAALSASLPSETMAVMDQFYCQAPDLPCPQGRPIHGDLSRKHVLLDGVPRRIGVIDFGNVAVGDPAWDFAFLWGYGDWPAAFAFDHYPMAAQDPDLVARSRWLGARMAVNRLRWRAMNDASNPVRIAEGIAMLKTQMAYVGIRAAAG